MSVARTSGQAGWVVILAAVPIVARYLPTFEGGRAIGLYIAVGVAGTFTFFFTLLNFLGAMMHLREGVSFSKLWCRIDSPAIIADPANFEPAGLAAHRRFRAGVMVFLMIASASWVLSVICPLGN